MDERNSRKVSESTAADGARKKPYTRPAIAEEESFQTFVLACEKDKDECGVYGPVS